MKLLGDSAADRIRTRRSVRNVCLSTSALGSALIVAAIMQASSAAAAGCPKFSALALSYTVAGESLSAVKTETCIPGKTVDMQHLTQDDLFDGVEAIISASDFIEKTAGAQLLFI